MKNNEGGRIGSLFQIIDLKLNIFLSKLRKKMLREDRQKFKKKRKIKNNFF